MVYDGVSDCTKEYLRYSVQIRGDFVWCKNEGSIS